MFARPAIEPLQPSFCIPLEHTQVSLPYTLHYRYHVHRSNTRCLIAVPDQRSPTSRAEYAGSSLRSVPENPWHVFLVTFKA